jgi:plastocyanin
MTSRIALLALLVASGGLAGCGDDAAAPEESPPAAATVSMPGFSFTPFTTTIALGGSVTFDFPAEPHNVIFAKGTGAPADIQQTINAKVSRAFAVAGSFGYDCTLHPGMSGVVVVR